MMRGLYTAYTGMLAQQQKMDTISNNLANVNTAGFKKDDVIFKSFKDMYMVKINDPEQPGVHRIGKASLGVKLGQIYTDYSQGSLEGTDNPFNMALEGTGMFAVGTYDNDGNLVEKYTRDGSFGLNLNGQLVNKDGFFLLGTNGPITVDSSQIRITENGDIYDGSNQVAQIKLVDFDNMDTLNKIAGGIYETTDTTQMIDFSGKVIQGYVEGSNVNSVEEMIDMINVMRTYEANQKVITTYDETMSRAANEVGSL